MTRRSGFGRQILVFMVFFALTLEIFGSAARGGDGCPASSPPPVVEFVPPTADGLRGDDPTGHGWFCASRNGGQRRHLGCDWLAVPGAPVVSVVEGVVTRIGMPYGRAPSYRLVEVATRDGRLVVRTMYVNPIVSPGEYVRAGQQIGWAQSLAELHGPDMLNHVHVDVIYLGVFVDPLLIETQWRSVKDARSL